MALTAFAGRVAISKLDESLSLPGKVGGDHKCTITWPIGEGAEAKISFTIKSSLKHFCSATTDYASDHMFASELAFDLEQGVEQHASRCNCKDKYHNKVTYFVGQCSAPDAYKQCWAQYKLFQTNEIKPAFEGRDTPETIHHHEKMRDETFSYNFEKNACKGDVLCPVEAILPGLGEGRTEAETQAITDQVVKVASGEITVEASGIAELIDSLSETDKFDLVLNGKWKSLYDSMRNDAGVVTVGELKAAYTEKLADTGISTAHMMYVAGLDPALDNDPEALDRVVEFLQFIRFLNPDCFRSLPANGVELQMAYSSMMPGYYMDDGEFDINMLMAKHGIPADAEAPLEEESFMKFALAFTRARLYAEMNQKSTSGWGAVKNSVMSGGKK